MVGDLAVFIFLRAGQLNEIAGTEVGQFVMLPVAPDVLGLTPAKYPM